MKESSMKQMFLRIMQKILSREVMTYLAAGGMTTVVNFITYYVLCNKMGIANMISNTIAWVVAVTFAYIVNNFWVFQSKTSTGKRESLKVAKFFSARIATLIVESAGMLIFIDLLKLYEYNLIIKGLIAIIVIILNYIFSKYFVFKNSR